MDDRFLLDIKHGIDKGTIKVIQYRYRTAYATHILLEMPRNDELEKILAEASGQRADNHVLYQITFSDGKSFSMLFSDKKMLLGLGVTKMNW